MRDIGVRIVDVEPLASRGIGQLLGRETDVAVVGEAREIDWIEADDYYAAVHTRGRRHLIRESPSSLENRLDTGRCVRVHRSAIISRVREFRAGARGEGEMVLPAGTRVPVFRRWRERIVERFRTFTR